MTQFSPNKIFKINHLVLKINHERSVYIQYCHSYLDFALKEEKSTDC